MVVPPKESMIAALKKFSKDKGAGSATQLNTSSVCAKRFGQAARSVASLSVGGQWQVIKCFLAGSFLGLSRASGMCWHAGEQ